MSNSYVKPLRLIILCVLSLFLASITYAQTEPETTDSQLSPAAQTADSEGVTPTGPAAPSSRTIYLKSREFVPGSPDVDALKSLAAAGQDRIHILVQLDFIPRDAAKEAYRAQDVELLAYVPDYAWIASVPAHVPDSVLSLPGVVWAGELSVDDKLDPAILANQWGDYNRTPDGIVAVYVALHRDETLELGRELVSQAGGDVTGAVVGINLLLVEMPETNLRTLAANDAIQWIEPAAPPLGEANDGVRTQIGIDTLQTTHPGLDGTGIDVLVYDSGQAGDHDDFGARLIHGDGDSVSDHSTHVAGTVGGDGTVNATYTGVAPEVDLISYGTQNYTSGTVLFYDRVPDIENDWATAQNTYGADIGTASLGANIYSNYPSQCGLYGNYGASSVLLDQIIRGGNSVVGIGDKYVTTWAAGNERNSSTPCGLTSYASIAPPGSAKNPIHVGAANTNNNTMTSFSSWGPTDDGRIKPTVVAGGCQSSGDFGVTSTDNSPYNGYTTKCGTSMATPAVAGSLALMLQHYRDVYNTSGTFWPATAKAILMHTADDLGNAGPDYAWGFGLVNIPEAVDLISRKAFRQTNISQGDVDVYYFVVGPDADPAKVTLVWDDFEATFNANPTLINDLNLELVSPSGAVWRPWILDPNNPANNATRGSDNDNNQEMVEVPSPEVGTWLVRVTGATVPQGPQDYALVCENCMVLNAGACQAEVETAAVTGSNDATAMQLNSEGDELFAAGAPAVVSAGEQWQRALEAAQEDAAEQTAVAAQIESALLAYDAAQEAGPAEVVALLDTLHGPERDLLMDEIQEAHQQLAESEPVPPKRPSPSIADERAANEAEVTRAAAERVAALALLHANTNSTEGIGEGVAVAQTPESPQGPTADLTVGAGCTHATISAAITAASPGDRLLLEGGVTFTENIFVNKNLTIEGGYNGCNSGLSSATTIDGNASGTVATIGAGLTVTLIDLNLTNGNTASEGGGIEFGIGTGTGTLTLDNVDIYGNFAQWGGGIWAGPDTDINGTGVNIYSNTASTYGGGMRLFGARASFDSSNIRFNTAPLGGGVYGTMQNGISSALNLNSAADVYDNQALTGSGYGGGVYISQGTIYATSSSDVYSNDAINGGGIYVISSTVTIDGSGSEVDNNQATGDGGGVYAIGSTINLDDGADIYNNNAGTDGSGNGGGAYLDDSNLWGDKAAIRFNVADDFGGGVYANNTSLLDMDLGSYQCSTVRCSHLDDNDTTQLYGGSVYANGSSEVDLRNTYLEDSIAGDLGGGIYATGSPVYLYNTVIAENNALGTAGDGMRLFSSANLYGNNNTFVRNGFGSGRAIDLSSSSASQTCSIIWEHSVSINLSGQNISYSDVQGGYAGTANTNVDPLFVSLGSDDYHLQSSSPVIDQCVSGTSPDVENDARPYVHTSDAAPYDMGADEVLGNVNVGRNGASCAYSSIQQAINAAQDGDTIYIAGGTYVENIDVSGKDVTLAGGYQSDCATIGGGTTTIDGGANFDNVIDITGGSNVTLEDLQLRFGLGSSGGGLYISSSDVTLDNTDVFDSHGSSGGGVYLSSSSVMTLTNDSDIYDNTATSRGGGGYILGTLYGYSTTSDTYYNCAPSGGGYYVSGGDVYLDNADVIANKAADTNGLGGGFYAVSNALISLNNSVFVGETSPCCQEAYEGGGIYADNASIILNDASTSVINHTVSGNGGGIYAINGADVTVDAARVGISSSTNQASWGGGIYATGSSTIVDVVNGGLVQYNVASGYGGGIAAQDGATITINGGTVANNDASFGGGIYAGDNINANPSVIVENGALIDNNEATSTSGGGLRIDYGASGTVQTNAIVSNNTASSYGGGIQVYNDSTLTLNGAIVRSNDAGSWGGGISLLTGIGGTPSLDLDDATIDNNTAVDGAGLYNESGTMILDATSATAYIINNIASGDGGGIYDASGNNLRIWANDGHPFIIDNNSAGDDGGGIYAINGPSYVDIYADVQITNNTATSDGGGIYQDGGDGWIDDHSTWGRPLFSGNTATNGSGGAYFLINATDSGNNFFDGVDFDNNSAGGDGGGVYADNSTFFMSNPIMTNNDANYGGGLALLNGANGTVEADTSSPTAVHGSGKEAENGVTATNCSPLSLPADTYCSEFRSNSVTNFGGGIYVDANGAVTVEDTAFIGNSGNYGAAVYSDTSGGTVSLTNGRFSGNTTNLQGTIRIWGAGLTLDSSTIAGNTGSGLTLPNSAATVTINNTIVWGNSSSTTSSATIGGTCNIDQSGILPGISTNPQFVTTARGDYHINGSSPAADVCGSGPATDLDNYARPKGANFDMGAFEACSPLSVSISMNGNDVVLNWGSGTFTVYHATSPYIFGTSIGSGNGTFTHVGAAGTPGTNHYYYVGCSGSDHMGEFDFAIVPGS